MSNGKLINVVGLGYIGLPTSLILAANKNNVVGTDLNKDLVHMLQNGKVTFEEGGLVDLYNDAVSHGIKFKTEYVEADIYIVTVPTPYDKESKKIDPRYILSATNSVIEVAKDGAILVIESTVSPGTLDKYVRPILAESSKKIELVHAPERILPGAMISELVNNSRTIGADSIDVANEIKELYETFCVGEIAITDIATAEMSKVVENTFRDINIAFANELAKISAEANLDVYEVIRIANKHPRVNILSPGPGVGGHCISVDPWFLVGDYPTLTNLILKARNVNDSMPEYIYENILEIMRENNITDFREVGLYGLSYKENVDDTRESPTLQFLDLNKEGMDQMDVFDPFITKKVVDNQVFSFDELLDGKKLIVVFVAHEHIIENDEELNGKIVFDTKNRINRDYKKVYTL